MTSLDSSPDSSQDRKIIGRGSLGDGVFKATVTSAAALVLVTLGLILVASVYQAWPALKHAGINFVIGDRWVPHEMIFGALPFIFGTAVTSIIALIFAVPIAIGIALFTTEYAPKWLRTPAITVIDLLAAIPSVVFGLVGILVVAPSAFTFYDSIHNAVGSIPLLGTLFGEPTTSGRTFFTAGIILAVMIIPIVTSISREVFSTVPEALKQASYALGSTRWEMIKGSVLPHSFGGLVGASMLGLGRAMGETIAVALVIGGATQITANLFDSGNTMAAVIVQQWGESSGVHTAGLVGIGVVLFGITVTINLLARVVVRRTEARMRGVGA
ncbi:phosphate ABC transporter permease subunit PstC [Natronoglycomyces albus]|uniref:Phosphate transport system permease protein n=1 Tax=Natronoglycomyces albus TaxID=2811108 RepID=A0A895XPW0_9ACTN|nr:phosphate ABC transporter permease subunit PstC [Natronoglycomyces albus]QSB05409.1 phosphate ABC transporter permease subunit PstC [Natronoglycomyces albus]